MMKFVKFLILLLMLTGTLLPFQNCSMTSPDAKKADLSSKKTGSNSLSGGGTGYDGKLTFVNRSSSTCSDGSNIKSALRVTGQNELRQLRENCQDLSSNRILTNQDVNLMAHNEDNVVHGKHVFDALNEQTDPDLENSVSTKYLCRGSYPNKNNKQMQVADVMIKYAQGGTLAHSARVIMAVYNEDGSLFERLDSGEIALRNISTQVEGRVKYVTSIEGRYGITLWIDKIGEFPTGKLSFIDLPYQGRDKEDNYNFREYERVIQNLNCYSQ